MAAPRESADPVAKRRKSAGFFMLLSNVPPCYQVGHLVAASRKSAGHLVRLSTIRLVTKSATS